MVELLITGGTGMVGKAIQNLLPKICSAVFVGSKDFDLANPDKTRKMMRELKPKNHFYFHGVKLISLDLLKSMKAYRIDEKDMLDLKLIESHL